MHKKLLVFLGIGLAGLVSGGSLAVAKSSACEVPINDDKYHLAYESLRSVYYRCGPLPPMATQAEFAALAERKRMQYAKQKHKFNRQIHALERKMAELAVDDDGRAAIANEIKGLKRASTDADTLNYLYPLDYDYWVYPGKSDLSPSQILQVLATRDHDQDGVLDFRVHPKTGEFRENDPDVDCDGIANVLDSSPYDRAMRRFHNYMKDDPAFRDSQDGYREFRFGPRSAWMVLTDSVSHACLSGQHALVSTFLVPLQNCRLPEMAPINVLGGA